MSDKTFKLPASNYEQLMQIIKTYAIDNRELTTKEVSDKSGIYKEMIGRNLNFLIEIGVITKENDNKHKITNLGVDLYRTLDTNLYDMFSEKLREIISSYDFLRDISKYMEIQKEKTKDDLINYIIYQSGSKKHQFTKAGAVTIIDMLINAKLLTEYDNKIIFNKEFSQANILLEKVNLEKNSITNDNNDINIEEANKNISDKLEYVDNLVSEVISEATDVNNIKLSQNYNDKIRELNKSHRIYHITFIGMIIVDIICVISIFLLNVYVFKENNDSIFYNIRVSILSISILGLLFWLTKYFNRRTHEIIHLIEEYEHKFLVINSFITYSKELERLSESKNNFLADYISKVSSTINKSPASNLNKRKSDNTPIEDLTELLTHLTNLINNKKNSN